uniref:Uncharacterized protein n=2 Tax=Triticum urartu TaxID=4572 RepID=A0A8R7VFZ3_TRIUA
MPSAYASASEQGSPHLSPVIASSPLTRDQNDEIKDAAVAALESSRLSSFVVAAALAWVCLLRSRSVGVEGTARSHMLFSTECRSRLVPPLPTEYFSNCLRACFVEATMEGLMTVCFTISSVIHKLTTSQRSTHLSEQF